MDDNKDLKSSVENTNVKELRPLLDTEIKGAFEGLFTTEYGPEAKIASFTSTVVGNQVFITWSTEGQLAYTEWKIFFKYRF